MTKLRFSKSNDSAGWKLLEESLPGTREVLEEIFIMLKLTNKNCKIEKTGNEKFHKYKIFKNDTWHQVPATIRINKKTFNVDLVINRNHDNPQAISTADELKDKLYKLIIDGIL